MLVNASGVQLLCTFAHFSSNNHLFDFLHGFNLHLMSYLFSYWNKIFFEKKNKPTLERKSLFWILAQGCSPLWWEVKVAAGGWHGCSWHIHNQKAMMRSGARLTFPFLRPGPSPGNGVTHGGKVFLLPKPNQDNPPTGISKTPISQASLDLKWQWRTTEPYFLKVQVKPLISN